MVSDEEVEAWAKREAAKFPPFTAEEAAEVGRMAARIDARIAEQAQQHRPAAERSAA